jgi:cation diffusion facilitator CzcD-associated flavoprotein CzcO
MTMKENKPNAFDAIIIGAGNTGLYQLYRLREAGFSVRAIEAGSNVGGTWYWNRYPGCRFDSESYSYGYSFSDELLQEWSWKEEYAGQPETLSYYSHFADRYDLRKDIRFNTRVTKATYDEKENLWVVGMDDGSTATSRFLITAVGILSAVNLPSFEGMDSFKGNSWHTARWPRDPNGFGGKYTDFTGERVAVIGTGASGVQVIQEVAKTAEKLVVFQRKPNWCAPLRNAPISKEKMDEVKKRYPEIFQKCKTSFAGFVHDFDPRSALQVSPEEREAVFEQLYAEPGFRKWLGNFWDTMFDKRANALLSEFMARKIRQRVKDPRIAEKLIPKDHGWGTRRVPLETNYFEAYNQSNVTLVDLRETPIERITPKGIKTTGQEYEFDFIVYATGFDAVTGSLDRIDISGVSGQRLKDKWDNGPRTYLGLQSSGFPNFFTLVGPHNGASFCNTPRCAEQNVDFVMALISHMRDNEVNRVEPNPAAEDAWTLEVNNAIKGTLLEGVDSWFFGKKKNFLMYFAGNPTFRKKCDEVVANSWEGFTFQAEPKKAA